MCNGLYDERAFPTTCERNDVPPNSSRHLTKPTQTKAFSMIDCERDHTRDHARDHASCRVKPKSICSYKPQVRKPKSICSCKPESICGIVAARDAVGLSFNTSSLSPIA